MRRLKDFGKTVAHVCIITAALLGVATVFVVQSAKATTPQSSWLNAAQLESLRNILHTSGVSVWPNHAADPYTCDSNAPGGYYYNTATNAFRVCDESSWQDGGGGVAGLNDLTDVTLSSPTNNQAMIFNSGSGDWENAAQGAAAIDDHSDATVTSPVSGHILEHNGSIWVNVAGASPTTLDGQSDTTFTSVAEGDYLIRNGTDWKNVNPSGSYHLFPYNSVMAEHVALEHFIVASANDVRVYRDIWENGCTVDRIVWANATVTGCSGAQGAVGLFTLDGNTKILDSGAQVYDTLDEIHNVDITNTYVEMGSYWVAYTSASISSSCDVLAFADPTPTTNPGVDTVLNTGNTLIGTAANSSTAGVFQATLGTITANDTGVNRPLIKFVCTDP